MNRILESVTMIIVAMLLSIGFTGQHSTHAKTPLQIKVNVVFSIQDIVDPDKDNEPTEIELLTQLYVERELNALDYVEVIEGKGAFELTIFVTQHTTRLLDGEGTWVKFFYVLTKRHADERCRCYVVSGLTGGRHRESLRKECKEFVADLAKSFLEKYKP